MKFIPAIDIKDRKCVRLRQGKEKNITVFNSDPISQAKFFEEQGCERIHLVDLDSAFGRSHINKNIIEKIRQNTNITIELGGGINTIDAVNFWINKGIDYLIIGSLAAKNPVIAKKIILANKGRIYIALDVLRSRVMIKGWVEESKFTLREMFNLYESMNIKGFILTDISRDGMLEGLDIGLIKKMLLETNKNLIVGGGLSNYNDLKNLKKIKDKNLEGVIAGKAFYTGNLDIKKSLEIFN